MKTNLKYVILSGIMLGTLAVSCVPESIDGDGNGLVPDASIDAGFTITETSPNHYVLKANSNNYIVSKWNIDGAGFSNGNQQEELFLPDAGKYIVKHAAIGQGGNVAGITEQTITVAKSDPKSGNLIQGGKFADATDVAKWTLSFPNPSGSAIWTFSSGKATFTAKGWERNVMYQVVNVEAGRTYQADALVSSSTGINDSWFEIYVGYNKPKSNDDYTGDGTDNSWLRGLNTWAGSGKEPFSGKISKVGSVNSNNTTGTFKATKSGPVYFAIRSGGNEMKGGVTITNVEFRGLN